MRIEVSSKLFYKPHKKNLKKSVFINLTRKKFLSCQVMPVGCVNLSQTNQKLIKFLLQPLNNACN